MSAGYVSISKRRKLVVFAKNIFWKSALPSDTLSVGSKLPWKYRKIVPLLTTYLFPIGRICYLDWSSPEALQFSQRTIIPIYSRDCRPVKNSYFRLCISVYWIGNTPDIGGSTEWTKSATRKGKNQGQAQGRGDSTPHSMGPGNQCQTLVTRTRQSFHHTIFHSTLL